MCDHIANILYFLLGRNCQMKMKQRDDKVKLKLIRKLKKKGIYFLLVICGKWKIFFGRLYLVLLTWSLFSTKYLEVEQIKFFEDSLFTDHKGCLPQILTWFILEFFVFSFDGSIISFSFLLSFCMANPLISCLPVEEISKVYIETVILRALFLE